MTTTKAYRARQPPSQFEGEGSLSQRRSHHHNASVTSNPSQPLQDIQRFANDIDYWKLEQKLDVPIGASPGSFQQSPNTYNFEEDTSHYENSFEDFLTTECSSENHISEHTTPQELIWEQQFISQDTSQPHIIDSYGAFNFEASEGVSSASDLHAIYVEAAEPLSKSISTEELVRLSLNMAPGPSVQSPAVVHTTSLQPDITASSQQRGVSHTLRVDTTPRQSPSPNRELGGWQRPSSGMRAPSPAVMISSYDTIEAQAEPPSRHLHSVSKRSRGSESSDEGDDGDIDSPDTKAEGTSSSHLLSLDATNTGQGPSSQSQRVGLDPPQRGDDVIPSIKDLQEQQQREERNADVQTWLATSDAGSEAGEESFAPRARRPSQGTKRRAQNDALDRRYPDKSIPGPGLLVEVESDDEYFDDVSISSSQADEHTEQVVEAYHEESFPYMSPELLENLPPSEQDFFPTVGEETLPELEDPLPRQFYRRSPWQDTVRGPISDARDQPNTSNAAAYRFNQEAAKWETASRAATWGTRRRLSESEVSSIVDGSKVRHLSLSKRGRERGNSFLNKARGLLPRRSNSNIKQEPPAEDPEPVLRRHAPRNSVGTIKPADRMPNFSKPKSAPLDTGSALMAMTGQLAAVGRGNSMVPETEAQRSSKPLQALRKQRSKSDVSKQAKSSTPGLTELMTMYGGPPIPTLASPGHEREPIMAALVIDNEDAGADDEEDDQADELAIRMDLEIRLEDITPSLEGFKAHARRLNPRLEPYLIDRIGHEQIRRYKKLVETKIKHTRSVQFNQKCSSGNFCYDLGGEATLLTPRPSAKDPEATLTSFQVSNSGDNEIDESGFTEGIVTPALFPPGIPLPPVKRLPAEFECQLCFKVKKFHKPSDWTKHVHEDVQPFSCTFPHCPESKSFKRKADWVRHENERHRHLEWWKCSIQECSHICYRKDNFVQHLVREHKMTEPKTKGRGSGSSKIKLPESVGWQAGYEDNEVWRMVESCRTATQNKARDERCRFCGNMCSSFKKLSVHMGRHMEQIAMPVLGLVNMRQVSADTVISPVEQPAGTAPSFATIPGTMNGMEASNLSPYPTSAASAYQTSSAGQSPASMHGRPQHGGFQFEQGYYSPLSMPAAVPGAYGGAGSFAQQSLGYLGSTEYMQSREVGQRHEHNLSPQIQMAMPRSQPMGPGYTDTSFGTTGADYSRTSLGSMYVSAPSMPGYMPQYASSMVPDHSSHSPMGTDGLGLQPMNQEYAYGRPGNGQGGPHMHFPS